MTVTTTHGTKNTKGAKHTKTSIGFVFFGIIARDELFLKVDDKTRGRYERAGMRPFKPYPDRPTTMKYYAVPLEVLESSVELTQWAQDAVKAASQEE